MPDLRRRAGLSPRGYIQVFKRHTGFRPGQLLIRLRIDLAERLLAEQRLSVMELVRACGFRRFRRETGVAPMRYQREITFAGFALTPLQNAQVSDRTNSLW